MRKSKTLFVTLVVLCLALSSLMASPSTWGWLQSDPSSEALEVPAETSAKEQTKSSQDLTVSKATSKNVKMVMIPEDVLLNAFADIEEGNAYNRKGGATVDAATASLAASVKVVKEKKFQYFGVVEGSYTPGDYELGVGLGFIFKNCIIGKVGVEKKNVLDMTDWLDWKNAYKATASLGIIF